VSLCAHKEPKVSIRLLEGNILEIEAARTLSNAAWPETSSWAVRCTSVEWRTYRCINRRLHITLEYPTNESNVIVRVGGQAWAVWQAPERGDTREDRVRLAKGQLLFARECRSQSSTWVPPSPGNLLYQTPSSGPTNGSWSWPWSP
jgi:hypothetical protein